jgi:hypothetical protein
VSIRVFLSGAWPAETDRPGSDARTTIRGFAGRARVASEIRFGVQDSAPAADIRMNRPDIVLFPFSATAIAISLDAPAVLAWPSGIADDNPDRQAKNYSFAGIGKRTVGALHAINMNDAANGEARS